MTMVFSSAFGALLALGSIAGAAPVPEAQHRHGDQREAFEGRRRGALMSIRDIERRVVPTMRGAQYLGFDFDADSSIYTLKFLRNGTVIWVDVEGGSGRIIGRTDR